MSYLVDALGLALRRHISDDRAMLAGDNPIAFLFAKRGSSSAMR